MDKNEDYIIGLDIGSNSVGWAVVTCEQQKDNQWHPTNLIDLNSYIFQEVVEAKTQVPLNVKRRQQRLMRRQTKRRARRRQALTQLLRSYGLLPAAENGASFLTEKQANHIDKEFAERITNSQQDINTYSNPFAIRAIGIKSQLTPYELGRAILHLQAHRGYRSNAGAKYVELLEYLDLEESDLEEAEETFEEKRKKKEQEMDRIDVKTVGEYVWRKIQQGAELKRVTGYTITETKTNKSGEEKHEIGLFATRDMISTEFDLIWEKQESAISELIKTQGLKQSAEKIYTKIKQLLLEQYPVQSPPPKKRRFKHLSYNTTGRCTLEPNKRRCRAAWPEAQAFRTWQVINNLKINHQPLSNEQRKKLFQQANNTEELNEGGKLTWKKVAKHLGCKEEDLNYSGDTDMLVGNRTKKKIVAITEAVTNQILDDGNRTKKKIVAITRDEDYEQYVEHLLSIVNKKALYDFLVKNKQLTAGKGGTAKQLTMCELETGYMKYSLKAIRKLLPELEAGKNLHDALEECGYLNISKDLNAVSNNSNNNELLSIERLPKIANPRVEKAVYATRRVINAIIKKYGKRPVQINIELSRDIKASKKHRVQIESRIKANEGANKKANEALKGYNQPLNHNNRAKYKCWHDEQDTKCLYCGRCIGEQELFSTAEWEHILPQAEFKQNYMNRVVSCRDCNKEKGNRTPYQAWGNIDKWNEIEERLDKLKNLPKQKKRRILMQGDIADNESFCERALKDTQYITTVVTQFLEDNKIKTQPSRGLATSELRHCWGLNNILPNPETANDGDNKKIRNDHRHHAIDALVVALTSHRVLMHLTKYIQWRYDNKVDTEEGKLQEQKKQLIESLFPETWCEKEKFRELVEAKILRNNVAIQKKTNVAGALHEDTIYGRSCYTIKECVSAKDIKKIAKWLEHKPGNKDDGDLAWIDDEMIYEQLLKWYQDNKDKKPAKKRTELPYKALPITYRCYVRKIGKGVGGDLTKVLKEYVQHPSKWPQDKKSWIADKSLNDVLYQWKEKHNLVGEQVKVSAIKSTLKENPIRMPTRNGDTVGNLIKSVRIAEVANINSIKVIPGRGIVKLGNNHHIDIFFNPIKKDRKIRMVTAMNAALRQSKKQPIIDKQPEQSWGPNWQYQTTLHINDLVRFDLNDSLLNKQDEIKAQQEKCSSDIWRVQTIGTTKEGAIDMNFRLVCRAESDIKKTSPGLKRITRDKDLAIKRLEIGVLGLEREC